MLAKEAEIIEQSSGNDEFLAAAVIGNAIVTDDASKNLGQASKEHHYPSPSTIAGANAAAPPPCNSAAVVATANSHNHIKKEEEVKKEGKYERDNDDYHDWVQGNWCWLFYLITTRKAVLLEMSRKIYRYQNKKQWQKMIYKG